MQESVEDAEVDKQLDGLIEDMLAQGDKFSDQQIIEHISEVVGVGGKQMTRDEIDKSDDQVINELKKKLKGKYTPMSTDVFATSPEMTKFEDFQDRAGKMMYQTDQILLDKWEEEERVVRKQKRQLDASEFG